jgi:hypothetical protein
MLDRLEAATLAELVAVLKPWSESSVKSALYWDVAKDKGYGVRTETPADGTQRYHLVLPKGVEAPLAHVESAAVKMAANKKIAGAVQRQTGVPGHPFRLPARDQQS